MSLLYDYVGALVQRNQHEILGSVSLVALATIFIDVVQLRRRYGAKVLHLAVIFVVSNAAALATILYAYHFFPTVPQVLFLQGVLLAVKFFKIVDFKLQIHSSPPNPYIVYAKANVKRLNGAIEIVPNLLYYIALMAAWEWMRRDPVDVSRFTNPHPLSGHRYFYWELFGFSLLLADQIGNIVTRARRFGQKRTYSGKLGVILGAIVGTALLAPPLNLILRRWQEGPV